MPTLRGRLGMVSQEGRGIKVGLFVACGWIVSTFKSGSQTWEKAVSHRTRSKVAARIKGTHVMCMTTLVGLL